MLDQIAQILLYFVAKSKSSFLFSCIFNASFSMLFSSLGTDPAIFQGYLLLKIQEITYYGLCRQGISALEFDTKVNALSLLILNCSLMCPYTNGTAVQKDTTLQRARYIFHYFIPYPPSLFLIISKYFHFREFTQYL